MKKFLLSVLTFAFVSREVLTNVAADGVSVGGTTTQTQTTQDPRRCTGCRCPRHLHQVCSNHGKIYANECLLACAAKLCDPTIKYAGEYRNDTCSPPQTNDTSGTTVKPVPTIKPAAVNTNSTKKVTTVTGKPTVRNDKPPPKGRVAVKVAVVSKPKERVVPPPSKKQIPKPNKPNNNKKSSNKKPDNKKTTKKP